MIKFYGEFFINAAFLCAILATIGYFLYAQNDKDRYFKISNWLFGLQGLFLLAASGLLLHIILTHQFNFYYVYNYTSDDLQLKYLISAFWGGQEGSFMLWVLFSTLIGFGLMRWTRKAYRGPVLFFLTLTQIFLLSMVSGISFGDFTLGASPFRSLAEAMPNAPFLQSNPDFVPQNGKGLNDLLKSPWMMIHPPILFVGFSMMTVPYCFAMAALWKRKYNEWVNPALPWTLGANVALLTAIFLGGYWAYVTLSFGGYWAWDPVENASFVPWLLGTAGIHTMIIQRKSSTSQKASIIFAILAYVAIVYETFLTRSGILSDASVHSFVDLGLYSQLVVFMLAVTGIGLGLFFYRYKELPKQKNDSRFLSREFMTFAGAMMLFLIGLVIILGTSSPIIGRLFTENPTPPEVSFYNEWTMPMAMVAAILTVLGQYLFWKKQDGESLAEDLTLPVALTCIITLASIIIGDVRNIYYMVYLLTAWFALVGNAVIMIRLIRQNPMLIGGALSHIGFAVLLLGILASSAYNEHLLDRTTQQYNEAIRSGNVTDEQGFQKTQTVNFLELKLNEPKVVNDKYRVTYEGYTLKNQERPGQQQYRIKFEPADGEGSQFVLNPQVYPMLSSSSAQNIEWSVDPDVRTGMLSDIYLYVSGSSYVQQKNEQAKERARQVRQQTEPAAAGMLDSTKVQKIELAQGETASVGSFDITLKSYSQETEDAPQDSTIIAVRANVEITQRGSDSSTSVYPLFSIYQKNGKNWSYAPPTGIPGHNGTVQFSSVNPSTGKVELTIRGVDKEVKEQWVLLVAEEKPFISVVWLGTFLLMGGFSISIFRHWGRERKKS
ncbi:heme lyase CcmF/NrfE family subunit [Fodinibius sediminis]|uniref:Cytochrome c-type biogenesis protein CcmF n=1 Tax=Fodinibius sediminis TaxID=1214077 RepID=A0A521EN38_9BACT|nr:cytochrome c biogenesis protein CcsA [Fodinibius sediminis]SMO85328.1 cytochrome c-type biogenesis protein CcmF [Fodinibius sediminis]